MKYEPRCVPWKIKEEEDLEALYTAIKAATLLADMLKEGSPASVGIMRIGLDSKEVPLFEIKDDELVRAGYVPIPGEIKEEYEYVVAENEILIAAVKKLPKQGIWEAELVCALDPVQDSPEEAPYYPFMLMIVNREDYFVLPMSLIDHVEEKPQELLQEYANAWRNNHIYPREIRCRDERTFALLKDFSEKTGTGISIYDGEFAAFDELQRAFMAFPNEDFKEETLEEMAEIIQEILSMPEEKLMTMPEELQEYLWEFIEDGMFPDDIAEELRRRLKMIPE